jgi:hypothetical protein
VPEKIRAARHAVGRPCRHAENVWSAADGTVAATPFTGVENQLWKTDQLADGSYRIASKADKLALTATFKTRPGNGVALQPFTGDDAQHWVIAVP